MIQNASVQDLFKIKSLKFLNLVSNAILSTSSHRVMKPLLFKMTPAPSKIFRAKIKNPQSNKIKSKMNIMIKNFTLKKAK